MANDSNLLNVVGVQMILLNLPSQCSGYSVLSLGAVKESSWSFSGLSRLFCPRRCLPVFPLNWLGWPIPDHLALPPELLGISEVPGRW